MAKAGGLYKNFTSGQALSYLDGSLPGGASHGSAWQRQHGIAACARQLLGRLPFLTLQETHQAQAVVSWQSQHDESWKFDI